MRTKIYVIASLAVLALAGCARSGGAGGGSVTLDEKDNGHTVRVSSGTTIDVVLHSTYWRFAALAGTDVLTPNRAPSVAASPPGSGCVPGGGCGTVTAVFTAVGAGVVDVRATRASCGEALACSPDQASYAVTIVVGSGSTSARPTPSDPGPASPIAGTGTVTASDTDNGRTITLTVGDHLTVQLGSTYWHFTGLGDSTVLTNVGAPAVSGPPPGAGCVPGGGCGTVTATYLAVAAGTTTVAADRTSCGEARRCTGAEGTYRLNIVVR